MPFTKILTSNDLRGINAKHCNINGQGVFVFIVICVSRRQFKYPALTRIPVSIHTGPIDRILERF
jgi:hypothetical protein